MNTKLRMETRRLLDEIATTLPAGAHPKSELPELLLAGIGLRNGLSFLTLVSVLPNMNAVRFRLGMAKALSDTAVSVWYFEQIESFDLRFQKIMQNRATPGLRDLPATESSRSWRISTRERASELPAMPVAASF